MAKKSVDPLKEKQRKQKILAAVLGVVFLGLLAFQLPRVLKRLHPATPPTASASTTTTAAPPPGTPTLAAPTLGGSAPATTTPADGSSGSLASSSTPQVQDNQLTSFSRFASKDPFAQQLSDASTNSSGGSAPSGSGSTPTGSGPASAGGASAGSGGQAPHPGSAVISVNGTLYTVPTGTDFPQASPTDSSIVPLFHLVSLTAHSAKISIVGGSYSSGAATVTLRENKPVTLMNTADGTRYVLILKPLGTAVPTAKTTTSSSTTTTVPVPPAAP
jgi:hypothetical protein